MNSVVMSHQTMEETFEYRHKKFDQSKRSRCDSLSSSSGDYECIHVEIERLEETSYTPASNHLTQETTFNNLNNLTQEIANKRSSSPQTSETNYSDDLPQPEAKRPRLGSFTESHYSLSYSPFNTLRHTSTPLNIPSTSPLPPTAAILPKISHETLHSICKYHGNMVRKYPKKERTPKDQERRNKNTIACRMSRRVKKLEHIAIEEQYKEFTQQTFEIIERSMRATIYLHELMKLSSDKPEGVTHTQFPKMLTEKAETSPAAKKKPFTIAYLTGNEE